jgi:hypothetical protein
MAKLLLVACALQAPRKAKEGLQGFGATWIAGRQAKPRKAHWKPGKRHCRERPRQACTWQSLSFSLVYVYGVPIAKLAFHSQGLGCLARKPLIPKENLCTAKLEQAGEMQMAKAKDCYM